MYLMLLVKGLCIKESLIAGELLKAEPLKLEKDATALVLVSVLVLVQTGTLLLDLHHIVRHNNVT